MSINVLYRISDKGRPKEKLAYATKENCLRNAIDSFGLENVTVFADNCEEETLSMIRAFGLDPHEIALGNAGALRHVMQYAMDHLSDEDIIYLLEDDFLHVEGAAKCIEEGLEIADYVTCYDHPDKYKARKDGGNRYVKGGGEKTKVFVTKSTHWKKTNSTTMTYACKVKTLKADYHVWKRHTRKKIPKSFYAYQFLQSKGKIYNRLFGKHRVLISTVPARSTHAEVEFLSPVVDWEAFG